MLDLTDRVIIVTGAARGIGAATARELARRGARVVVTARRLDDAERVAAECGGVTLALALDVADPLAAEAAVRATLERHGQIDALVNNAAVIDPIGRIADTDPQAWLAAVTINLGGPFLMARAVLPAMVAAGRGTIVNVSTGAAFNPLDGWSAYCASKAGLAMLTRSIDHEYGAAGIVVTGFSPGLVDTAMQNRIRASGINRVSQLPREALGPAHLPAILIAYLCGPGGAAHAGKEVDIRDASLRAAAGLPVEPGPA